MNRLERALVLSELADQMRRRGSWCGHTHLQKAVYFLQHLMHVPTEYRYVLYMYGPYSFDLMEDLTSLRAADWIAFNDRLPNYRPELITTDRSRRARDEHFRMIDPYRRAIQFVAERLGSETMTAKELEKLATALYVTLESNEHAASGVEDRAQKLHAYKPHIPLDEARAAIQSVDAIIYDATAWQVAAPEEPASGGSSAVPTRGDAA